MGSTGPAQLGTAGSDQAGGPCPKDGGLRVRSDQRWDFERSLKKREEMMKEMKEKKEKHS